MKTNGTTNDLNAIAFILKEDRFKSGVRVGLSMGLLQLTDENLHRRNVRSEQSFVIYMF